MTKKLMYNIKNYGRISQSFSLVTSPTSPSFPFIINSHKNSRGEVSYLELGIFSTSHVTFSLFAMVNFLIKSLNQQNVEKNTG